MAKQAGVTVKSPLELSWWGLIKGAETPNLRRVCSLSITRAPAKRSVSAPERRNTRVLHCLSCVCVCVSALNHLCKTREHLWPCDLSNARPAWAKHRMRFNVRKHSKHLENFKPPPPLNKWVEGDAWFSAVIFSSRCTHQMWCRCSETEPENIIRALTITVTEQYASKTDDTFLNRAFAICFLLSDWFLCVRMCDMPDIQFPRWNY